MSDIVMMGLFGLETSFEQNAMQLQQLTGSQLSEALFLYTKSKSSTGRESPM